MFSSVTEGSGQLALEPREAAQVCEDPPADGSGSSPQLEVASVVALNQQLRQLLLLDHRRWHTQALTARLEQTRALNLMD